LAGGDAIAFSGVASANDGCVRDLIAERNRLRVGWAGRSEISIPGLDEVK